MIVEHAHSIQVVFFLLISQSKKIIDPLAPGDGLFDDGLDTFAEEVKLKTDPKRKGLYIFIYSLSKKKQT